MARTTCLIGVSPAVVEGCIAGEGEGASAAAKAAFAPEAPHGAPPQRASLAGFLAGAQWPPGLAVLVFPTGDATFRRLKFPFREPRRIRQVIRFELETELLDDIGQYTIDQEIAPAGEAGAEVQAYLVPTERVQGAVAACRAAGLAPYRVTLSAHALLAARPPTGALVFQVYAGADESFVALVRNGRIEALRAVSTGLPALVLDLHRQGIAAAADVQRVLAGEVEPDGVNRALVRSRMINELAGLAAELNLFMRAHDQGEPFGVECHGLFGGFLRLGDAGRVEVAADPPRPAGASARRFLGIMEDLQSAAPALRVRQGVNFYVAGTGLLGQWPEFRRPLLAAAVLLALVVALSATRYTLQSVELWRQRSAVESQIQAILRKHIASNPPVGTGVPILRERVQKARDEAKGSARFATYRYDALTLLSDVSGTVGQSGVTVESLSLGKERLALVGTTPSFQASEALKNRLGALGNFKGKEPKLTHQRAGQTITFRITID